MYSIFQELISDLCNMNTQLFCGFVYLFWKTCYILLLPTLAFTGRKRIYQWRRERTQSLQYLPNTPCPLLYFPQMTHTFIFAATAAQLSSVSFLTVQRRTNHSVSRQCLWLWKQNLIMHSLRVNGRIPTDLGKTKLGLYRVHTAPTLNQQHIVIRRRLLTAFSKCVNNSFPRLMGNPRMAWRSLKKLR